jgi:predicted transcriptional regulator
MAKVIKPTELELAILKVLWQGQEKDETPLPVREVRKRLMVSGRALAHTSVITMLNIMVGKKLVNRTRQKNALYFAPAVAAKAIKQNEIGDILRRVFDGSAEQMMSALLDSKDVDVVSIVEIKRLISAKSKELNQK